MAIDLKVGAVNPTGKGFAEEFESFYAHASTRASSPRGRYHLYTFRRGALSGARVVLQGYLGPPTISATSSPANDHDPKRPDDTHGRRVQPQSPFCGRR